jgi:hypothetical protein
MNQDLHEKKDDSKLDSKSLCDGGHKWDNVTGTREAGRPHIGIKSKWVRTCQKCGKREVFSSGIFNGWFSE